MKQLTPILVLLCILVPAVRAADPGKPSFDDYGLIVQRNIFDPDRQPQSRQQASSRPAPRPEPVVEQLDLLGTVVTDQVPTAFVSGRDPLRPGQRLADWEVRSIDTEGILLAKQGEELQWPVGRRIQRIDKGDWKLEDRPTSTLQPAPKSEEPSREESRGRSDENSDRRSFFGNMFGGRGGDSSRESSSDESSSRRGNGRESSGDGESRTPAASSGESQEEIMRRMMERRQRESGR